MIDPVILKKQLHQACLDIVLQRIENAREALEAARDAANGETKSSAGDKYETGRAMMQQEQEKSHMQLMESTRLKNELLTISPEKKCEKAEPGSLVITNLGRFYISGGIGKLKVGQEEFFAISLAAPIGKALSGKRAGEEGSFQNRKFRIIQIA